MEVKVLFQAEELEKNDGCVMLITIMEPIIIIIIISQHTTTTTIIIITTPRPFFVAGFGYTQDTRLQA